MLRRTCTSFATRDAIFRWQTRASFRPSLLKSTSCVVAYSSNAGGLCFPSRRPSTGSFPSAGTSCWISVASYSTSWGGSSTFSSYERWCCRCLGPAAEWLGRRFRAMAIFLRHDRSGAFFKSRMPRRGHGKFSHRFLLSADGNSVRVLSRSNFDKEWVQ